MITTEFIIREFRLTSPKIMLSFYEGILNMIIIMYLILLGIAILTKNPYLIGVIIGGVGALIGIKLALR
jgi:hypothetical protein